VVGIALFFGMTILCIVKSAKLSDSFRVNERKCVELFDFVPG